MTKPSNTPPLLIIWIYDVLDILPLPHNSPILYGSKDPLTLPSPRQPLVFDPMPNSSSSLVTTMASFPEEPNTQTNFRDWTKESSRMLKMGHALASSE